MNFLLFIFQSAIALSLTLSTLLFKQPKKGIFFTIIINVISAFLLSNAIINNYASSNYLITPAFLLSTLCIIFIWINLIIKISLVDRSKIQLKSLVFLLLIIFAIIMIFYFNIELIGSI